MFGKLIKHEFRAMSRVMLPISLIVVLTAVTANFSIRGLGSSNTSFVNILLGLFIAAFVISMIAAAVMSVVVMVMRFYKNILRDEGYLMMTLPVSVHGLVWSKILVSLIWMLIVILLIYLAVFATAFNALCMDADIREILGSVPPVRELIREFLAETELTGGELSTMLIEGFLAVLIGAVCSCLQFYAAMSLGHCATNHKILLSVVAYFALNFVFSLTVGNLAFKIGSGTGSFDSFYQIFTYIFGADIILGIAQGVILYLITAISLKKGLNLA